MITGSMDLHIMYVYLGSDKGYPRIRQKHESYIRAYDRHFSRLRNTAPTVLEIGCGYPGSPEKKKLGMGGSLILWREFFGKGTQVVGIDIIPECKEYEDSEAGINIEIGDQVDPYFLELIVRKYGPFDIIIDDGSHLDQHMKKTFDFLFPYLKNAGIYAVEDLDGFVESGNSFMSVNRFVSYASELSLRLQKYSERVQEQTQNNLLDYKPEQLTPMDIMISNVSFYRNLVIVEKDFSQKSSQMPMPPHYFF